MFWACLRVFTALTHVWAVNSFYSFILLSLIDPNPKDKPLIYVLSLGMNLGHPLTCFYEFKVPKLFLNDPRIYSKAIGGVI